MFAKVCLLSKPAWYFFPRRQALHIGYENFASELKFYIRRDKLEVKLAMSFGLIFFFKDVACSILMGYYGKMGRNK